MAGQKFYVNIEAPDGTVGAPSYSFYNDTNTGFWRSATDTIQFVTNGAAALTISTTSTNVNKQLTIDDNFDVEVMYWMRVNP